MKEQETNNNKIQNNIQPGNQGNNKIQNKSHPNNVATFKNTKIFDLNERLLVFAKRILGRCKQLPRLPECEGIRRQLADAGTSIGANFEEADAALTKKDFINKANISRKEAKETRFWLRVIGGIFIYLFLVLG